MNRQQAQDRARMEAAITGLGFTPAEVQQLRRISMTLRRWHELECGTGEGQRTWHVEREGPDGDGKPVMVTNYPTAQGWKQDRHPIADREAGALRRLARIMARRNGHRHWCSQVAPMAPGRIAERGPCNCDKPQPVSAYVQTDPRGTALYILRPGDVPEGGEPMAYYTNGIAVY